jgi:hypothetical protein
VDKLIMLVEQDRTLRHGGKTERREAELPHEA